MDVDYLANGELTGDMVSETIPEPAPELRAEKPGKDSRRLIAWLLALSLVGNIALFFLWQHEKQEEALMEEYCTNSAAAAAEHFADYANYGTDANYWQGVAQFRAFMTSYSSLRDESMNYRSCNVLYSNLLFEKEKCDHYIEELRKIMRLLKENKDDTNVYLQIDRLNNEIKYGCTD